MEQNQASLLLQKAAPIIMRELGPKLEPLIAEKVIIPIVKKVGPPLARRIAYPLARRACTALFNRVGSTLLNQALNPDIDNNVSADPKTATTEPKTGKFRFRFKKPSKGLKDFFPFIKAKTKSLQTPSDQVPLQNPLTNQIQFPNQQTSPATSVPPADPLNSGNPELFNENQIYLPNFNTSLPGEGDCK